MVARLQARTGRAALPGYPEVSTMVRHQLAPWLFSQELSDTLRASGLHSWPMLPRSTVQTTTPSNRAENDSAIAPDLPEYPAWSRDGLLCSTSPVSRFLLLRCAPSAGGCGVGLAVPVCCGRSSCPSCSGQLARARSRRLAKSWGGRADLGVLVVTLAPSWHEELSREVCRELETAIWAALMRILARGDSLRAGGRVYWHPCGDICRQCGESGSDLALYGVCRQCGSEAHAHPHLNFLIPLAGVRPDQSVVKIKPWVDVELLRAAIGQELEEIAERHDIEAGKVQAHWSFRRKAEKKQHALRYFSRPFPGWEGAMRRVYGKRVRRLGLDPDTRSAASRAWRAWLKSTPLEGVKPVCPCCDQTGTMRGLKVYASTCPILFLDGFGGVVLQVRGDDGLLSSYLINRDLSTGS